MSIPVTEAIRTRGRSPKSGKVAKLASIQVLGPSFWYHCASVGEKAEVSFLLDTVTYPEREGEEVEPGNRRGSAVSGVSWPRLHLFWHWLLPSALQW